MAEFTDFDEVQRAVRSAEAHYRNGTARAAIALPSATDTVTWQTEQSMEDYGLPGLWTFTGDLGAVRDWWLQEHPNGGAVLPRRWKERVLCYQVNLQWQTEHHLFNYHLTVP